jgi:SnoaL-like domain
MSASPQHLVVRQQVEDTVIRLFVATDERDWPMVESCFTDPFILDMTSMAGGSPASMTPHQVAAAWADGFKTLDHVHHQVGNFRTSVDGERAKVRCYGIALHHRAKVSAVVKTRVFVGTYDIDLTGQAGQWRIGVLKFNLKFIDGNLELEKAARIE